MSVLKVIKVKNGDRLVNYSIYKCDICGCNLPEQYPIYHQGTTDYCYNCSFKQGLINEKNYLDYGCGVDSSMFHAGINPYTNGIVVWRINEVSPWLRGNKEERHSKRYIEWRKNIFKRDNYTCQKCGQHGGALNAHHIKSFAKFKKLRFEANNGITLCKSCHRKEHRKKVNGCAK